MSETNKQLMKRRRENLAAKPRARRAAAKPSAPPTDARAQREEHKNRRDRLALVADAWRARVTTETAAALSAEMIAQGLSWKACKAIVDTLPASTRARSVLDSRI